MQIVLNDDRVVYPNIERREWDFEEGSEDEDGDDLVIVVDGDNPIKDQEWGAKATIPFEVQYLLLSTRFYQQTKLVMIRGRQEKLMLELEMQVFQGLAMAVSIIILTIHNIGFVSLSSLFCCFV